MQHIQNVVSAEAIARLADRLYREADAERSQIFRRRLIEEEDRYAQTADRLALVTRHIEEAADRIKKQSIIVQRLNDSGQDALWANQFLNTLVSIHDLLGSYRNKLLASEDFIASRLDTVGRGNRTVACADATDRMEGTAEQSYRLIIEQVPNALIMIGPSGVIVMANAEAERIFGYPRIEMLGRSIEILLPERFRSRHPEMRSKYFSLPRARPMGAGRDVYGLRKDASEFPVEIGLNPIETNDGTMVLASVVDITERKAAELALRESEHRNRALAAIVESSDDAIVSVGLDGLVASWNSAAERMFGYSAAEIIGQPIVQLAAPGLEAEMLALLDRVGRGDRVVHYETVRRHKDGHILQVLLTESPIYGPNAQLTGASKVVRDITQAKATREALDASRARLQELNDELLHVSRLSAMGQMAAMVTHEINQPLTAISNYMAAATALIGRGAGALPRLRTVVERTGEQAVRAGRIIERLRGLVSRGESEKRIEPVPPLLQEARELALIGIRQKAIALDGNLPDVSILADKIQIQQVLLNLLRNAAEAVANQSEPAVGILAELCEDELQISVTDNGPGLPEEVQGRLFQPFVSTKETGMGIGLSICHAIIGAHDGRLWAEANPTGGTIFRLALPIASAVPNDSQPSG